MNKPATIVFDASALLCVLRQERGSENALPYLVGNGTRYRCCMSAVNLTEVVTRLLDFGLTPEQCADSIMPFELEIIPYAETVAIHAAWLRTSTKSFGLSLGDRACIATAQWLQDQANTQIPSIVLTTDQAWTELKTNFTIQSLRPKA